MKIHSSCEIEDFVETHLSKLCVLLSIYILRTTKYIVCSDGYGSQVRYDVTGTPMDDGSKRTLLLLLLLPHRVMPVIEGIPPRSL